MPVSVKASVFYFYEELRAVYLTVWRLFATCCLHWIVSLKLERFEPRLIRCLRRHSLQWKNQQRQSYHFACIAQVTPRGTLLCLYHPLRLAVPTAISKSRVPEKCRTAISFRYSIPKWIRAFQKIKSIF